MLTDDQCDEFRRLPVSFNDMVRAIYCAGSLSVTKNIDNIADVYRPRTGGCPCLYTTPCHQDCTCVNPHMSHGCSRCARKIDEPTPGEYKTDEREACAKICDAHAGYDYYGSAGLAATEIRKRADV